MGNRHSAMGNPSAAVAIASYKELRVWQKEMDLAEAAYRATEKFPTHEAYGMTSQIRRAAVSIAANIAEGYGRGSSGAYLMFLRTSRGSLLEFETHIAISCRVGLLSEEASMLLNKEADGIGRMLSALIRSVEKSATRPGFQDL